MPRVPLLSGPSVAVVNVPDDGVVLRPPAPTERIADVPAAVRDAIRFPLTGDSLDKVVRGAQRVTVVVELPNLPIPGAPNDPRRDAIEAVSDELAREGVPTEAQTLLVAGGLARRAGPRELQLLVSPEFRRRFHGTVVVHDAADPDLRDVGTAGNVPLRVNRELIETDAVVVVSAAESVLHGGPAALLAAGGAEGIRAAGAWSLLQAAASQGWHDATALEHALSERVRVFGVSIVLNHPRLLAATLRGFPFDEGTAELVARAPVRRALALVPSPLRARVIRSLRRELTAAAAFAGPPSVAHAEALLRGIARRSTRLERPLDAIVIGMPWKHHHSPRERLNPLTVAAVALGLALRLWRDSFPLVDGGTAIVLHRLTRHFAHATQDPYRALFLALRDGRAGAEVAAAERAAAADDRALTAYRAGRACHPLLPYADWDGCRPALDRLGAVLVAGCRDHQAARTLGFVPTHGVSGALEMAHGLAGGRARIGFLLGPPYFPLAVGGA